MCLPVACGDVCILDGVAAVEHFIVAHIDAHMRSPCRIIGALEENQITGLGVGCGHSGADASQSFCAKPPEIPADAAVVIHP